MLLDPCNQDPFLILLFCLSRYLCCLFFSGSKLKPFRDGVDYKSITDPSERCLAALRFSAAHPHLRQLQPASALFASSAFSSTSSSSNSSSFTSGSSSSSSSTSVSHGVAAAPGLARALDSRSMCEFFPPFLDSTSWLDFVFFYVFPFLSFHTLNRAFPFLSVVLCFVFLRFLRSSFLFPQLMASVPLPKQTTL